MLGISRGIICYNPRPVSDADLKLMHRIDKLHMEFPFAGSRMLRGLLVQEGFKVGRLHVATLMKRVGIAALHRKPNTSKPATGHKIYPYLLRKLPITRPNQVGRRTSPTSRWRAGSSRWRPCWTGSPRPRPGLAGIDHAGGRLLHRSSRRGAGASRHARDLQHASGQSVNLNRIHQGASRPRDQDQHGWQGGLARQRLRRAPLADYQIRGDLSAGLCQRVRDPGWNWPISELLQQPSPAFIA